MTSVNTYASDDPLLPDESAAAPPLQLKSLGGYAAMFAAVQLLAKGVSFFMLPVYSRYFSPADYGAIELTELTLDVLQIVAGQRLLAGVFRFYYKTDDQAERKRVVSTAMLTIWAGYAVAGVIALLFAQTGALRVLGDLKYTPLFQLAALNLFVLPLYFVSPAFLRLQNRFPMLIALNVVRLALQVTMNVVFLVVLHLGPKSIFLSTLIANTLMGGIMAVIVFRGVGTKFDGRIARDLYRFGGPLIVTQFATFILTFGDRPFLRVATDLSSVGRYTLAYQFAFLLATLTQTPFDLVWEPKKFEIARRPEAERNALYARAFLYENVLLFGLAVGLSLFVHAVLVIMTRPAYYAAGDVVPVLLIAIILQTWTAAQDIGINISEKTVYIAWANWIAAGVVVLAYWALIPRYAGWGAAIATAIAYGVRYGITYWHSQRLWRVNWHWTPVIKLMVLSVVTVLVGQLVVRIPSVWTARGLSVLLYFTFAALVWFLPILSPADRAAIKGFIPVRHRR